MLQLGRRRPVRRTYSARPDTVPLSNDNAVSQDKEQSRAPVRTSPRSIKSSSITRTPLRESTNVEALFARVVASATKPAAIQASSKKKKKKTVSFAVFEDEEATQDTAQATPLREHSTPTTPLELPPPPLRVLDSDDELLTERVPLNDNDPLWSMFEPTTPRRHRPIRRSYIPDELARRSRIWSPQHN